MRGEKRSYRYSHVLLYHVDGAVHALDDDGSCPDDDVEAHHEGAVAVHHCSEKHRDRDKSIHRPPVGYKR